jgi:general stress protein 26
MKGHAMNLTEDTTVRTDGADESSSRTRLWDLIHDIRFAMFTTRHANGHLHSRPVTTQNSKLDEDANLWFFMSRSGDPVADLVNDPTVSVVYADPNKDRYVSVSGTASVVDNMAKKQQLWSKLAEAYFPAGINDPDLALVQVKIIHASYWDVKESKLVQLYQMAKAAFTGKPPTELGEHAEIRMR